MLVTEESRFYMKFGRKDGGFKLIKTDNFPESFLNFTKVSN